VFSIAAGIDGVYDPAIDVGALIIRCQGYESTV